MDRKMGKVTLRELLGPVLLAALLVLGLLGARQEAPALSSLLEGSAAWALAGDLPRAREAAQQARDLWVKRRLRWAATQHHDPMEQMDALFRSLQLQEAPQDFARSCTDLAVLARSMEDSCRLTWENVL